MKLLDKYSAEKNVTDCINKIVPLPEFNANGVASNNNYNTNYNNNNNNNSNFNRPPMPIPPQATGSSDIIKPEDRQKYIGLFNSFGPENNILNGKMCYEYIKEYLY